MLEYYHEFDVVCPEDESKSTNEVPEPSPLIACNSHPRTTIQPTSHPPTPQPTDIFLSVCGLACLYPVLTCAWACVSVTSIRFHSEWSSESLFWWDRGNGVERELVTWLKCRVFLLPTSFQKLTQISATICVCVCVCSEYGLDSVA